MSAVIKKATPFVVESVLLQALDSIGAEPKVVDEETLDIVQNNRLNVGDILTNRRDYNGRQLFRKEGDCWIMMHDAEEYRASVLGSKRYSPVVRFLADVSTAYELAYERHIADLEEKERIKLEEERIARVELARKQAIAKAKAQGYSIKEGRNSKGQIQLVLTRMV